MLTLLHSQNGEECLRLSSEKKMHSRSKSTLTLGTQRTVEMVHIQAFQLQETAMWYFFIFLIHFTSLSQPPPSSLPSSTFTNPSSHYHHPFCHRRRAPLRDLPTLGHPEPAGLGMDVLIFRMYGLLMQGHLRKIYSCV